MSTISGIIMTVNKGCFYALSESSSTTKSAPKTKSTELLEQASLLASANPGSISNEVAALLEQALQASAQNDITLKEQKDHITLLDEKILALKTLHFGRRSEKSKYLAMDGQIVMDEVYADMFDEAEALQEETEGIKPSKKAKRKQKRAIQDTLQNLPHIQKVYRIPEDQRICPDCGGELTSAGVKHNRFEIEVIPAKINVIDICQETCQCLACTKAKGESVMVSPSDVPTPVIQHSFASASAITQVITDKFEQHVPLYRQEKTWAAMGLKIDRSTLSNWVIIPSEEWFAPIVDRLKVELRSQDYLHADETPVQVLKEPGRDNTKKSYMWLFSSTKHCRHPVRLFHYEPSRAGSVPQAFLDGVSAYLVTDDYSGYNGLSGITRAACLSHVRRKFVEVPAANNVNQTIAQEGVQICNALFELERTFEGMTPEERFSARLEKSVPVLNRFWEYVDKNLVNVSLKSKLGMALQYANHNRDRLGVFLQDGHIEISNAIAENAIRPFALGRRNWLFSGSPRGATASACVYSLIETAKANDLLPRLYIRALLEQVPGSDYLSSAETMNRFMPWSEEMQATCKAPSFQ